ncbi:MAG: adenosylmethionine--8-amino-7-oxononanoate transaminase [Phycisphaeraceae bacterium]|nr:adenosylmethionine--8-amino-7-oxononanoate transaminase [Phycisphaeraceae bacterium]
MTTTTTKATGTETARLAAIDHAHVWHPFTAMRQWRERAPIIIERAEGFTLFDTEGRRYIDGYSSLWCNVHGHRVPAIDDAVREQLGRVAHATMLGSATVPAIELAARLVGLVNRQGARTVLNKVFFSDAGATATELAFKMAAGFHHHGGRPGRDTFIGVRGAYHGDTTGAMSVGYDERMHRPFAPMLFRNAWAMAPDVCRVDTPSAGCESEWPSWDAGRRRRVRDAALADLDRVLEAAGDRAAAVVIEPLMQGAAGMIEQPEGYLSGLAERARTRGIPLIADEVAVGLCRTGTTLACEQEGVEPDILCLAKGLSGGYLPLAATLCTDEIAGAFEGGWGEHRTLYHGHTFTGNPLACAAANASIDLMLREDVNTNAQELSALLRHELRRRLGDHPNVGDVRLRGVLCGIELVAGRSPWAAFDPSRRVGAGVCEAARSRGLMIRPLGDVVVLNPAPAMDSATAQEMLSILIETIGSFDFGC